MTAMDGGNENNAGCNYFSLAPRHTVHPVHRLSLPSLAPRHTVHPVHKNRQKPVSNTQP